MLAVLPTTCLSVVVELPPCPVPPFVVVVEVLVVVVVVVDVVLLVAEMICLFNPTSPDL